ncbi:MAG: molybdate ABC transporter substrate-binding protein [Burkholderiales bacterium]
MRRLLAVASCLLCVAAHAQSPVVVFAAASLKNALDEAATRAPVPAVVSYASSSTLAKQIANGAPAEIFISADLQWMDYLEKRDRVRKGSRGNLLGNRLVLIAPAASAARATIEAGFPIARLLGRQGRLALGDPTHVPAGKYAKAALESLGVWDSVKGRLAPAENVRAALALVARAEAPLGVVYSTDAAAEPRVRVVGTFPERSHPPIIYPVAIMKTAKGERADLFLEYLDSPTARGIFKKYGFTPLN